MNLETLKQIVKVAKEEGVAELKVETKEFNVSVNFVAGAALTQLHAQPMVQHIPAATQAPLPSQAGTPASPAKAAGQDTGLHLIKSPFVGTFYISPSPGKPAYVKVGDRVKVGQPLCVLEAMKIMNEIDADKSGEIVEICVDNESLVEFGQPLFKIKPV
jgi:acetyl-CoA carboxylase biotin carboxyl carrier protein